MDDWWHFGQVLDHVTCTLLNMPGASPDVCIDTSWADRSWALLHFELMLLEVLIEAQ